MIQVREPRHHPVVAVRSSELQRSRVDHLVLGPADGAEDDRGPELARCGHVLRLEDLLHEGGLIVRVVDHETRADADRGAIPAQDPGADRVECAGLDVPSRFADEADDPLAQLPGRAVRKGDSEDLPRTDALDADQVGDAVGENARLAAAGARQDEERPLGRGHGLCLLRIQAGKDPGRQDGGGGRLVVRGW